MKNNKAFILILFLSTGLAAVAQGATPPPPMPPPPPGLPIDSGLMILFTVAFSFGVFKAYKIAKDNSLTS
ncbi:hypothetical protein BWZ20_08935 [Winogradskyella sp. J14-2]|nr:hypothetical protein BWZ20_08935 [Winogradskyella sp. J14-2]